MIDARTNDKRMPENKNDDPPSGPNPKTRDD